MLLMAFLVDVVRHAIFSNIYGNMVALAIPIFGHKWIRSPNVKLPSSQAWRACVFRTQFGILSAVSKLAVVQQSNQPAHFPNQRTSKGTIPNKKYLKKISIGSLHQDASSVFFVARCRRQRRRRVVKQKAWGTLRYQRASVMKKAVMEAAGGVRGIKMMEISIIVSFNGQ